jgi:cysteine desulfurase/selenocysteine lyase
MKVAKGSPRPAAVNGSPPDLDVQAIRKDFPVLARRINGSPLVYLDNAATTQKPQSVIDSLNRYYSEDNSNVHRGVHTLSQRSTDAFEEARAKVQRFVNARESREIIFVRGATEAINLVAASFLRWRMKPGDEVLISAMEHHSNIVPWQIACETLGGKLRVAPINDDGELLMDEFESLINGRTRLVSVVHVSNSIGTINPIREIVRMAHRRGVPVLVDGAQAAPHLQVDVQDLGCDFYAFSGHKIYGPTGIGVLYGRAELLEQMPPYQGGGEMIRFVTFQKTHYNVIPHKFEAGTPDIAGVIGLGAAVDYLNRLDREQVAAHEARLLRHATAAIAEIPGIECIGKARRKASILSFVLEGVHPHDIGTILDQEGIAIRTGHHCTQPLMQRFGLPATARASIALYNTHEEIERLVAALAKAKEMLG